MSKSKDELQQIAEPLFDKLGKTTLYATTDGQVFIEKRRAEEHAKGGTMYRFQKDGGSSEAETEQPKAPTTPSEDLKTDADPLTQTDPLNRGNEPTGGSGETEE